MRLCRCPLWSSCPQRTVRFQPMTRSPPGNTPPQGTPSTRSAPKTHCSHCTSPQDTRCKLHLSRCPPLSSCRARTVRCRSMSCSPPSNTPPQDTHCTRLWFRCLQPRSFRQRTRHSHWRWSNRLNSTCRPGKHCTTHFQHCQQSRSCLQHTGRSRSTSCIQAGSTPPQDMLSMHPPKWNPRSYYMFQQHTQCKPRLRRCRW